MTQESITKMQLMAYIFDIKSYSYNLQRKWFFDIVPVPLPEVGDFINTLGGIYYELENSESETKPKQKADTQGVVVKITTRVFVMSEYDNVWHLQLSGTVK